MLITLCLPFCAFFMHIQTCQFTKLISLLYFQICFYTKLAYLFDHPGTVFYAVFMSFWGKLFILLVLVLISISHRSYEPCRFCHLDSSIESQVPHQKKYLLLTGSGIQLIPSHTNRQTDTKMDILNHLLSFSRYSWSKWV